jgi:excisionase family DNA binding protein
MPFRLITPDCVGHFYQQADRGRPAAFANKRAATLTTVMALALLNWFVPPMETDLDPLSLLTLKQTADLLRVSPQVVRVMIQRNELLAFKVGRQWRIRSSQIAKWIAADLSSPVLTPDPTKRETC